MTKHAVAGVETGDMRSGATSEPVERVLRHIDALIETGVLRPGDAVNERNIGTAVDAGRVPVREAVRILAGEGVLELLPRRSPRVRVIGPVEMLDMYQVSTSLTMLAMRNMCEQKNFRELAAPLLPLSEIIHNSCERHDVDAVVLHTFRFHEQILKASGNRYICRLVERTRLNRHTRSLMILLGEDAVLNIARKYPTIAQALYNGSYQTAGSILDDGCTSAVRLVKLRRE